MLKPNGIQSLEKIRFETRNSNWEKKKRGSHNEVKQRSHERNREQCSPERMCPNYQQGPLSLTFIEEDREGPKWNVDVVEILRHVMEHHEYWYYSKYSVSRKIKLNNADDWRKNEWTN